MFKLIDNFTTLLKNIFIDDFFESNSMNLQPDTHKEKDYEKILFNLIKTTNLSITDLTNLELIFPEKFERERIYPLILKYYEELLKISPNSQATYLSRLCRILGCHPPELRVDTLRDIFLYDIENIHNNVVKYETKLVHSFKNQFSNFSSEINHIINKHFSYEATKINLHELAKAFQYAFQSQISFNDIPRELKATQYFKTINNSNYFQLSDFKLELKKVLSHYEIDKALNGTIAYTTGSEILSLIEDKMSKTIDIIMQTHLFKVRQTELEQALLQLNQHLPSNL